MATLASTVSVCTLGGYIAYQQRKLATQAAHQEASVITTGIAAAVASDLISKNYDGLEQTLKPLVLHSSIETIELIKADGNIVLKALHEKSQQPKLVYGGSIAVPTQIQEQSQIEKGRIITLSPIMGGSLLGWVRLELSLTYIDALEKRIWQDTALTACGAIVLSILIISLLLRKPMTQIRLSADFAETLPQKHVALLDIPPCSSELKRLLEALNSAAQTLSSQDDELKLLHSLIEYSADPVYILNVEDGFRMRFANDAACLHFGMSREKLLQSRLSDLNAELDQAAAQALWQRLRKDKYLSFETRHKTLLSNNVPVQVTMNYLLYQGKPLIAGYFSDISQRKKMENALRTNEKRLEEIINMMPIAIFITDPYSRILIMNKICEQQWGISSSRLKGMEFRYFFSEEKAAALTAEDQSIFASKQLFEVEESIWNDSLNSQRTVHTYKKPVFDENGEPLYLIGISIDITETKQQQHLLEEAKSAAEKANQAKSDFIANMSHEIRTPMNAVIGMSHLMLNTHLNQRQQDFMKKILLSSQHLLGIINDILDFSKIEADKLIVENTEFEIEKLLDNVATLMLEKTVAKSLELLVQVSPTVPDYAIGDSMRLGQILINYLSNAVKFTKEGQIVIELQVKEDSGQDLLLYFAVRDSGIGLTE